MTAEHVEQLPLLLRRETFGGLLFVPGDAVHIELDQDGYAFFLEHTTRQCPARSTEEKALLQSVLREIGNTSADVLRLVDYERDVELAPFAVYNAPTLADFQITTQCDLGCPHCYAASAVDGEHAPLSDIELVLQQLSVNGVTQIAIGGGEPLGHPDVLQVLELCHAHGLVPNLTTNGQHLGRDRLRAMQRYCGAVALSLEGVGARFARLRRVGFDAFQDRLQRLQGAGIATVLQVTLSCESFEDIENIVEFCLSCGAIYGVIFLAYKRVGRGADCDHTLFELPPARLHRRLRGAFMRLSGHTRVGYDCCLTPALVGVEPDLHFGQRDQLEGCSALRSSLGVLPNLDVTPCTFTPELRIGNLRETPLHEVWRGAAAQAFRGRIQSRFQDNSLCAACDARLDCLGGCPVFELVRCQQPTALQSNKAARVVD